MQPEKIVNWQFDGLTEPDIEVLVLVLTLWYRNIYPVLQE
jgi:hypothetical protein